MKSFENPISPALFRHPEQLRRTSCGAFYLVGVWLFLLGNGCQSPPKQQLTLAVAANAQFAIDSIMQAFTAETEIACQMVVGSSGKLSAQIQAGAPYHLFISADTAYPNRLYRAGFGTDSPWIYAYGQLVLWTCKPQVPLPFIAPTLHDISHLVLPNPRFAPYGRAAMEVLQQMNIDPSLPDKLILGESVAQTNQFILLQTADMGFTAKSTVLAPVVRGKGRWQEVPDSLYRPIAQGALEISTTDPELKAAVQQFMQFLETDKARSILAYFGYGLPEVQQPSLGFETLWRAKGGITGWRR